MKQYQHLFFDLDGTLWDLKRNTRESLLFLFQKYADEGLHIVDFETFLQHYFIENDKVWKLYRENKIEKSVLRVVRFARAFTHVKFPATEKFVHRFSEDFSLHCPQQPHLVPGTLEMLNEMHGQVPMHIITNGFSEIQQTKMEAGGISHFFQHIIYSESCGMRKPSKGIFEYAIKMTGADVNSSLMTGDDWEADILGAKSFGMDQCWLAGDRNCRTGESTMVVCDMKEFTRIIRPRIADLKLS